MYSFWYLGVPNIDGVICFEELCSRCLKQILYASVCALGFYPNKDFLTL